MEFVEGFDESFLETAQEDAYYCMVPVSLMKEKGIALGDTIRIATDREVYSEEYDARIFYEVDLKVIGCFENKVPRTLYTSR